MHQFVLCLLVLLLAKPNTAQESCMYVSPECGACVYECPGAGAGDLGCGDCNVTWDNQCGFDPASNCSAQCGAPTCREVCDIVIKGRTGYNDGINGVYKYTNGTSGGRPYYSYIVGFLYYNEFFEAWVIGSTLGQDTVAAGAMENTALPQDTTIVWQVYNSTAFENDPLVYAECVVDCSETTEICPAEMLACFYNDGCNTTLTIFSNDGVAANGTAYPECTVEQIELRQDGDLCWQDLGNDNQSPGYQEYDDLSTCVECCGRCVTCGDSYVDKPERCEPPDGTLCDDQCQPLPQTVAPTIVPTEVPVPYPSNFPTNAPTPSQTLTPVSPEEEEEREIEEEGEEQRKEETPEEEEENAADDSGPFDLAEASGLGFWIYIIIGVGGSLIIILCCWCGSKIVSGPRGRKRELQMANSQYASYSHSSAAGQPSPRRQNLGGYRGQTAAGGGGSQRFGTGGGGSQRYR